MLVFIWSNVHTHTHQWSEKSEEVNKQCRENSKTKQNNTYGSFLSCNNFNTREREKESQSQEISEKVANSVIKRIKVFFSLEHDKSEKA